MKLHNPLLAALLAAAVFASGCLGGDTPDSDNPPTTPTTGGNDTPPDEEPTTPSYTLTVADLNGTATAGEAFTFTLTVEGAPEMASDHIGAHYGANSTTEPSTTVYDQACAHQQGTAPGTFNVTCVIAEAGTYYLRGHLRITQGETQTSFWSDEHTVTVEAAHADHGEPEFTLTATDVPAVAFAGQDFTFNLTIEGDHEMASDHIGAHYGANSTTEPSTTVYDQACAHQQGTAPGTFAVTCNVANAGTIYLRGHLRVEMGDMRHNFWTDEFTILVGPSA